MQTERLGLPGVRRGGGGWQRWTDRVVAAGATLDATLPGQLVAVVGARHAGNGEQDGEGGAQEGGVMEPAGQPGDVVVAHEGDRRKGFAKGLVTAQRPGQLEEVGVVEGAPDRLVQLVLRDAVEPALLHEAHVVAVHLLAEEEGLGVDAAHRLAQSGEKGFGDQIGHVQAPAVGAAVQPVAAHRDRPFEHLGVGVVERDQLLVALEVGIGEAIGTGGGEIEAEPGRERRGGATGEHVPKRGEGAPHMVEDAVQDEQQVALVAGVREGREVLLITQALVDPKGVDGVVAVGGGDEDRGQQHPAAAQRPDVVEPCLEPAEAASAQRGGLGVGIGSGGPSRPQAVEVVEDAAPHPGGKLGHGSRLAWYMHCCCIFYVG